jgi:hypothetical protein
MNGGREFTVTSNRFLTPFPGYSSLDSARAELNLLHYANRIRSAEEEPVYSLSL